ncbi:MAG: Gfo/Idh/MocA family oxidoreductase [Actinomyces sp.]|uniref:Gfo/Idh/MocA family protein n=1 Tax=Actinomyces sp. TaxID=29317 RepID=UPI0026DACFF7|nr:Gfo/Idh/MocA family oxidoreductase [Actinomyces sp.]MDO4242360.1 Gfo/Idh/MocA family oxidoreductase [Actinomyces sp.]
MSATAPPCPPPTDDPGTRPGAETRATAPPVRFAVVGTGFISGWFMEAVAAVPQAEVVAVTSGRPERAAAFAAEHGIGAAWPTFDELVRQCRPGGSSPADVVYIGSTNVLHAEHALAALEAGLHVVVEKPFAITPAQADAMVEAAQRHDRFLMEAWLTAFEPGTRVLRETLPRLLSDGPGPHRAVLVKEQFSSRMPAYRAGALPAVLDPAKAGGSVMDLGVYPVSLAIHLFGPPARIGAGARLLDSGVDSHGVITLDYDVLPDGSPTDLQVVCLHSKTSTASTGSAIASDTMSLSFDDCQWPRTITLHTPQGQEDLSVAGTGPVLARELAEVCRLVSTGQRYSPLHPPSASAACVRVLAEARRLTGIRLPEDAGAKMGV